MMLTLQNFNIMVLIAVSLFNQSCAPVSSTRHKNYEKNIQIVDGDLYIFEGSYFHSRSGEVFDLNIESPKDQDIIKNLSHITNDEQKVCLSLSLKGLKGDGYGLGGRAIFYVKHIVRASRVKCVVK